MLLIDLGGCGCPSLPCVPGSEPGCHRGWQQGRATSHSQMSFWEVRTALALSRSWAVGERNCNRPPSPRALILQPPHPGRFGPSVQHRWVAEILYPGVRECGEGCVVSHRPPPPPLMDHVPPLQATRRANGGRGAHEPVMSSDVLCSPASRMWLDSLEPSARSSLLASRLPRHPHSPSHGPEMAWTFGCRLCRSSRKDAPAATWKMSFCWGPMEKPRTPSAKAWPCKPRPCLQSVPNLWDLKPRWGLA